MTNLCTNSMFINTQTIKLLKKLKLFLFFESRNNLFFNHQQNSETLLK